MGNWMSLNGDNLSVKMQGYYRKNIRIGNTKDDPVYKFFNKSDIFLKNGDDIGF